MLSLKPHRPWHRVEYTQEAMKNGHSGLSQESDMINLT